MFFKRKKNKELEQEEAARSQEKSPEESAEEPQETDPKPDQPQEEPPPKAESPAEPESAREEKPPEPEPEPEQEAEAAPEESGEQEEAEAGEPAEETEPKPEKPKKKRGFFSRLAGRKEQEEPEEPEEAGEADQQDEATAEEPAQAGEEKAQEAQEAEQPDQPREEAPPQAESPAGEQAAPEEKPPQAEAKPEEAGEQAAEEQAEPDQPDEEGGADPEKPKKKRGFFSRLAGRKEEAEEPEEATEQAEAEEPDQEGEPAPEPEEPPEPAKAETQAQEPAAEEEPQPEPEPEPGPEKAPEPKSKKADKRAGKTEPEPEPEEEPEEAAEPQPEPGEEEPEAEDEASEEEAEKKKGFFSRLAAGLSKTRQKIGGSIDSLVGGRKIDDELLDELEEVLITADIGMATTMRLMEQVRRKVARKELKDAAALKTALADHISEILGQAPAPPDRDAANPHVMMVVGVNGVGKTTTIGKMAHYFQSQGKNVLLAAGDTFRAAASEQLTIWAGRVGCDVVGGAHGADPSSVAYDAIDAAVARGRDLVIIDTAGRLQTKKNLMDELKKIERVVGKRLEGAPHEVVLVLDATTGQNAISQAKLFNETVPLTGLVLTKLDGSAKGGVVVAISGEMELPILFVGLGETMDDLKPFQPQDFAQAMF